MRQAVLVGIPMFLAIVGILFFAAGSPPIGIMPRNYANFAGLAFIMFSGLGWVIYGVAGKSTDSKDH